MKNTFFTLLFIAISNIAFSQLHFGLKGGITHTFSQTESVLLNSPSDIVDNQLTFSSLVMSPQIGISAYSTFGYIWLQSDLLFQSSTTEYVLENYTLNSTSLFSEKNKYGSLQILSGVTLGDKVRIGVGPVFRKTIDRSVGLTQVDGLKESNNTVNNGFIALVGFEIFENVFVDISAEQFLSKSAENYNFRNMPLEFTGRAKTLSISLSCYL